MNEYKLSRHERRKLARIILSLCLFAIIFTVDKIFHLADIGGWIFPLVLYLTVYLMIGYDVLFRAARNIFHGELLDENFLMCVATIGAFALAIFRGLSGDNPDGFDEGCAVLLFYQVGEFFQDCATGKSRSSIASLMNIRPDYANVVRGGEIVEVEPDEVKLDEIIVVNPGERIPLDGVVSEGKSSLDTKALTGESIPREVFASDEVISGCVNMTSQLKIRVTKEFYDSTVSKILDLVENASEKKAKTESFITKFAQYYTPIVVCSAVLLAVVPSLITGEWSTWTYRALNFLVASCPCALVISIPMSFFSGIGAASRRGILIKGSNFLEKLYKSDVFVFDKTGTLTRGTFEITSVTPSDRRDEIIALAAIAENGSSHPIARSILTAGSGTIDEGWNITDISGCGILAEKENETILCGNEKLMEKFGIEFEINRGIGTVVYVAENNKFVGSILISDTLRGNASDVIGKLKRVGAKTIMLSGDRKAIVSDVAEKLSLDGFRASLLPADKVNEVENLMNQREKGSVLTFVGDGINDSPVLMRADIGIAMGGIGSDAALEAADIVLMRDNLDGITEAIQLSRKTMTIVYQNIIFTLAIKLAILVLSAVGIANMWLAVFADVGVAVIAILNAMRIK